MLPGMLIVRGIVRVRRLLPSPSRSQVNTVSETLGRSFQTTDEAIFRDAQKDAASTRAYRALAKLHETFGLLGENVTEIADTKNKIRDLEARADELKMRNTAEAIERMSTDLKELREQNNTLASR